MSLRTLPASQQSRPLAMVIAGYSFDSIVASEKKGRPQPPPIPQRNFHVSLFWRFPPSILPR